MTTEKKKPMDHFYKLLGSGRNISKRSITINVKESSDSLLLSTNSSFYNTNKKSESYLTLIQMLKNDLYQIQDMINSNTKDIKMFKLLSKAPGLSKKLSEIENNKSVKDVIEKITEMSQKTDKIFSRYGCKDSKALIEKIFLELSFNELLLEKIYDFFILMKLSVHKDDTYQESLSKIISIKSFIDKTVDKFNEKNNNKNNNEGNIIEYKKIKEIKSMIDLIKFNINNNINDKNFIEIFNHIIKLINEYFEKKNKFIINEINLEEKDIGDNCNCTNDEIEKFEKILNKLIESINNYKIDNSGIKEKNDELIKKIEEMENNIKEKNENQNIINLKSEFDSEKQKFIESIETSNKKYVELKNEYDSLKAENEKLVEEINTLKEAHLSNNTDFDIQLKQKEELIINLQKSISEKDVLNLQLTNQIKELEAAKNKKMDIKNSEIYKLMNNYDSQLKKIGTDLMNQNGEEMRILENKYKNLESKYNMILLERETLKKNIIYLKGKRYDPDSYEEVLKEQFETMRNAFQKKIEDLNEELNDVKRDSRIKVYQLELELKENIKLKNNFLKQIISLQSQVDMMKKEGE